MNKTEAKKIVALIKAKYAHIDMPADQWFLHDYQHQGLKRGNWSLASQGYLPYDWPWYCCDDTALLQRIRTSVGWWVELEAFDGAILHMYDQRERGDHA